MTNTDSRTKAALKILLFYAVIGSFLASVPQLPAFGRLNFLLELVRSFPQFVLPGMFAGGIWCILLMRAGKRRSGALLLILALVAAARYSFPVVSLWRAKAPPPFSGGTSFSLLIANAEFGEAEAPQLLAQIDRVDPDLIFMSEVTTSWLERLNLGSRYAYRIEHPGARAEGCALYSRFPLERILPRDALFGFYTAGATVMVNGAPPFRLLGVHAPPPTLDTTLGIRNYFFKVLGAEADREPELPLFIAGDFNTSPAADAYSHFVAAHSLTNAAQGFGWRSSWFLKSFPLAASFIDYGLFRGSFAIDSFELLTPFGSDHLPVFIRARIPLIAGAGMG